MTITDQGFRVSYPADLRGAMLGRINVGSGPHDVTADEPLPITWTDPRISPQTIVVPVAGNEAAATLLAGGWWIAIDDDGTVHLHTLLTPTDDLVLSYVAIG